MNNFNLIFLLKLNKYLISGLLIFLIFSSCDEEAVAGCMDSTACNFNANATESDDSCEYPQQEGLDCDGNCTIEVDCAGNCGGSYILDDCEDCVTPDNQNAAKDCIGVCDGDAVEDCEGICNGDAIEDECGVCNGDGIPEGECDCYSHILDECGVCGGDGIDCSGNCCSNLHESRCLVMITGESQTPAFTQSEFCEEHFSNDGTLENDCNSFTNEDMVTGVLGAFCELHFGCAQENEENTCSPGCTGGSTGLIYYDLCGCFEPNADNYWCNDGGQCPVGASSVPSEDLLDCQEECITGIPGSYIGINPYTYDNGFVVNNTLESCMYYGCLDANACNYDSTATDDDGSCYYDCEGCTDTNAANYDQDAIVDDQSCQYSNYIKIGEETDSTIEFLINSNQEIAAFQFELSGVTLELGSGSGGLCEDSGLTVSTGPNGVLAFSLTGAIIPTTGGQEVSLTTINYATSDGSEICLPNSLVISNPTAGSLDDYLIHYESICPE